MLSQVKTNEDCAMVLIPGGFLNWGRFQGNQQMVTDVTYRIKLRKRSADK
jgi:hypothetical protein